MADTQSSYRSRGASRATIVIRKAKDADAERVAAQVDADEETGRKKVISGRYQARQTDTGIKREEPSSLSSSRRGTRVHGHTVIIRKEDGSRSVSSSVSGRTSVRLAGGDAVTRYKSGEVVIRRTDRYASLRRQALWLYAIGYFLLFGLYGYFLFAGTHGISPDEFLRRAFARRHSSSEADLELAALEAMRGNRTPAEVRLAERLSFHDEKRNAVTIEAGERLTLRNAAKLGAAIIEDRRLPEERRSFRRDLSLYRDNYLGSVNWPRILAVYNALGFFLLVALFLWRPLGRYLGAEGKKTAAALRSARSAVEVEEEEERQEKFRQFTAEANERGLRIQEDAETRAAVEREAVLTKAQSEAADMAGSAGRALAAEARGAAARLAAETAEDACRRAGRLLAERLGPAEHDMAITELVAAISGMKAGSASARPAGGA